MGADEFTLEQKQFDLGEIKPDLVMLVTCQ
jgi:hypothetical protein